jgi:hypothetical protein
MHGDMIGLVALDFILRFFLTRVVRMTLVKNVFGMHLDDLSADVSRFRVSRDVVTGTEFNGHDGLR